MASTVSSRVPPAQSSSTGPQVDGQLSRRYERVRAYESVGVWNGRAGLVWTSVLFWTGDREDEACAFARPARTDDELSDTDDTDRDDRRAARDDSREGRDMVAVWVGVGWWASETSQRFVFRFERATIQLGARPAPRRLSARPAD